MRRAYPRPYQAHWLSPSSQVLEVHLATQVTLGPAQLWLPDPATVDLGAILLAGLAGWLLLHRKWGLLSVLGTMALAGAGWSLAIWPLFG